ncbi:hypothetical protein ACRZ5S_06070 [Vibrio scophthalmi]|uniref:WD40 repeat protein n=1 Tax=Vibrio scophthalmi TaxID=45658 RepID=A0A1E3WNM6_9VIBR|nr:hypothetical protein [Vibrio scophthalmi]ODS11371.1 hypothetical protein VSF3289_01636 [Vibrio scophthalmi]
MKLLGILLACFSLSVWGSPAKDSDALSYFDHPFLLGDWYLVNPNPEDSQENFLAIKLTLDSKYNFKIDIQKRDYSVDHWEGMYTANDDTIILGLHTDQPQVYQYSGNHNLLNLNGVVFTKALSNSLAGMWSSEHLAGYDLEENDVNRMDLVLQPDFIFQFKVSNKEGDEAIHQGVYYTEGENLVLLYENGEHNTRYKLNQDTLTIETEEGEMFAVLNRIR